MLAGSTHWLPSLTEWTAASSFSLSIWGLGSELLPSRGLIAAGEATNRVGSLLVWAEMLDSALNIVWATSSLMAPRVIVLLVGCLSDLFASSKHEICVSIFVSSVVFVRVAGG